MTVTQANRDTIDKILQFLQEVPPDDIKPPPEPTPPPNLAFQKHIIRSISEAEELYHKNYKAALKASKPLFRLKGKFSLEFDDIQQIILKYAWWACLTYDPARGKITTWMYSLQRHARYEIYRCYFRAGRLGEVLLMSQEDLRPETFHDFRKMPLLDRLELVELLEKNFETNDPRKAAVLIDRYVCDLTLQECGEILNLTRERVRQLEEAALQNLKNSYGQGDTRMRKRRRSVRFVS